MTSTLRNSILFIAISLASLGNVVAQVLDISSGGVPTITGAQNGSVTGSTSVTTDLAFTINLGEISPINTNNIVKVVIPIAIRSQQPYQVSVSVSGATNANIQALQRSDIGFGVNNIRALGPQAKVCTLSQHIFYSPFNNDPTVNVTTNSNGRVAYASTLANLGASTVILSGPRLSSNSNPNRQGNDGYVFNAIFAVTPQFYAAGTTSLLLTFTIAAGPNVPC